MTIASSAVHKYMTGVINMDSIILYDFIISINIVKESTSCIIVNKTIVSESDLGVVLNFT